MKLSVVLPNYNHSQWLPISLGAIIGQTRPPDELIVIDDGSRDDSLEVMQRILADVPYARIERNPQNIGCVPTMNRGLEMASGNYVYFAAADDLTAPDFFERSLAILEAHPQAALSSAKSAMIDQAGHRLGAASMQLPSSRPEYIDPAEVQARLLKDDSWFMGNTVIYRREPLAAAGGFPVLLAGFTDGFMCRGLAARHGCCFVPEELASWRQMPGGLAWSLSADIKKAEAVAEAAVVLMGSMFGKELSPEYRSRWQARYIFGAYNFSWKHSDRRRDDPVGRLVFQLHRAFAVGVMFLKLRSFDIWPVLRRRTAEFLR